MTPPSSSQQPAYGRLGAILFVSVLMGFAVGAFFYRNWVYNQRNTDYSGPDSGGGMISSTQPQPISTDQTPAPSSLNMIETGPMGTQMKGREAAQPVPTVTYLIRQNESRYRTIAIQDTQKYPVLRQYGKDWASYPDLMKYNMEYAHDHDPIKFAYEVSGSKNFATLVTKYSGRPEILQFVSDIVKATPAELFDASRDFLRRDNHANELLRRFTHAIGLPDAMAAGLTSGNLNANQASSLLKDDPRLREFLKQGNVNPNEINADLKSQQQSN